MDIREILNGIFYVGVNDRTTTLFESLWPLPYGVSYNSYIVKGEKTALIDTVLIDESRGYESNISAITGGKHIDYLVINHMEPDHSSSIPAILALNPEMKIVANRKAIEMVKGFYHITDESVFHEVKDGDSLDLGGKTLTFYMTPMVHWPETMMTYVKEEAVLFSGDAFGTFGALNGGITDTEMETDIYMAEMYRYYSNIVGKYGRSVQAALKKLSGLEIKFICPTHGPVWNDRVKEVVGLTDRLSRGESEEGVVIVYGSMYGNTAEVADCIARELSARGIKRIKVHNASHSSLSEMISDAFRYKGLIVGTPTYSMHLFPAVEAFLSALETREVKGKTLATFGSFTWAPNVIPAEFKSFCEKTGMEPVASMSIKQSMTEADRANAAQLAEAVVEALNK